MIDTVLPTLLVQRKKCTLKEFPSEDVSAATRLTKKGRLLEATALLQRVLTGKAGLPAPDGAPAAVVVPGTPPRPLRLAPIVDAAVRETGVTEKPVRSSGQFLTASYSNAAGTRAYKLYVPSAYCGKALPLIVMLHGCSQSPDDLAAGTRMNVVAEEFACLVAYPAQPASANPGKCWNWFKPGDQRRDEGEPSLIAGITRAIMAEYAVDPSRVYVAGLSAGGGAAAVVAAAYPDVYAALGVHSGVPCGIARDVSSAFMLMQKGGAGERRSANPASQPPGGRSMPTILFHGDRDTTVHPSNADLIVEQSAHAGWQTTVKSGQVEGEHAYTRTSYSDESGRILLENWVVHGAGHAWLGGSPAGSFTEVRGPDASRLMMRFFLEHRLN